MTHDQWGRYLTPTGQLQTEDGTLFSINDHAYLVCEPPGEPYYIARIMEFLQAEGDQEGQINSIRVNWYYRPKDIHRKVQDPRLVFATMHSDTCPLTSLRGKCHVHHISEISKLDDYRSRKDSFWFDKLFDRYIHRYYEVIPTNKVINVPRRVKKVLDDRWKFVLVEIGRAKDLTSAVKTCKRCGGYAANNDSVDCAVCKNTYHMACVRPVLTKKPARGFAWACAACSRAQEKKLEARQTPMLGANTLDGDEDILEEDEEELTACQQYSRPESPKGRDSQHPPATKEQLAQATLWPYRYLGVHSRPEDALDYDDRIYPRASSRLGPRHQANVTAWHGRPVELVKTADIRKKYNKPPSHKKDAPKPCKESLAFLEADGENNLRRPKWVIDEPPGYIARGEDVPVDIKGKKEKQLTAHVIFKMPDETHFTARGAADHVSGPESMPHQHAERLVDEYMERVKPIAAQYGLQQWSTNFLTKAIEMLYEHQYDADAAILAMKRLHVRNDLQEPDLSKEEIRRFEDGVSKYGSELHSVSRHVGGDVRHSRIVRFYYMWKKTERGRQIWGTYEGRKSKKDSRKLDDSKHREGSGNKLVDDIADDHDDSAFDTAKASSKKRGFVCKFCSTKTSRRWRRAPGAAPGTTVSSDTSVKGSKDRGQLFTVALCGRCAYLWRRYAIQFESIEDVSKKIATAGGRASKRRVDEELMRAIVEAQKESGDTISSSTAAVAASAGIEVPTAIIHVAEPPRKKAKLEKDAPSQRQETLVEKKKAPAEKPLEPVALKPEPPRVKTLPCAVCGLVNLPGDDYLSCRDCRLAVHKSCYGVPRERNAKIWYCDMCSNDRNTMVSTAYECVLCPVKQTPHELMEPPKVSHKKKTEREREKERKEKEMVEEAVRLYRQQQEAAGRPSDPREPLKRTAWNNWIHVLCALWTPEIKFGHANILEPAEGVGFIPADKYKPICKFCKSGGRYPIVACHAPACSAQFHVGCAHLAGCIFCFDITPVKGSRRDIVTTIKLGDETGYATATICCPHHAAQPSQHSIVEATEEGLTALQVYARSFKQADQSMTGTVRRAGQFNVHVTTTLHNHTPPLLTRRGSTLANGVKPDSSREQERMSTRHRRSSPDQAMVKSATGSTAPPSASEVSDSYGANEEATKVCCQCRTLYSPKWWRARQVTKRSPSREAARNGSCTPSQKLTTSAGSKRIPHGQQRQQHESFGVINNFSPQGSSPLKQSQASPPGPNGTVKRESDAPDTPEDRDINLPDELLFQCHKCHLIQPLPLLSSSPVESNVSPTEALLVPEAALNNLPTAKHQVLKNSTAAHQPTHMSPHSDPLWESSAKGRNRPHTNHARQSDINARDADSPNSTVRSVTTVPAPPSGLPPPPTPPDQHSLPRPNGLSQASPPLMHGTLPSTSNEYTNSNPATPVQALQPAPPTPLHYHLPHHTTVTQRQAYTLPAFSTHSYHHPPNGHLRPASPPLPPSSGLNGHGAFGPRWSPPRSSAAAPMPYAGDRSPHRTSVAPSLPLPRLGSERRLNQHHLPSPGHSHPNSHSHSFSCTHPESRPRGHSLDGGYDYASRSMALSSLSPSAQHQPYHRIHALPRPEVAGYSHGDSNLHNKRLEQEPARDKAIDRATQPSRQLPLPGPASASPSLKNLLS